MKTNGKKADNEASRSGVDCTVPALTTAAVKGSDDMATSESTTGKSPAFQFYPKDFISDRHVVLMSMAERGVYITLLCQSWQHPLPNDVDRLARLCGLPVTAFRKLWPAVRVCFTEHGDNLIQPRLERERQKQVNYKRDKSEAGKAGADKRWQKDGSAKPLPSPEDSRPTPMPTPVPIANDSSSSALCSLQSSSSDFGQKKDAPVVADHRSKRPVFIGQRLKVFDWMLDDIYRLLGKQAADALSCDSWFLELDARVAASGEMVPQRDGGQWLQQQTLEEAEKRGLIEKPEHKSKLTKALEAASNGW